MKNFILLLILVFAQREGFGQNFPVQNENPRGWVSALSLDVKTNEQPIRFATAADYSAPKIFPSYFLLSVKAPRVAQWVITASLADVYSNAGTGAEKLNNLIKLKSRGQTFIMSTRPQVIVQSNGNIPLNEFNIDLIVDPPFNTTEGIIPGFINFHLELL